MALTQEKKELCVIIINKVFQGIYNVQPHEITEDVAQLTDAMYKDITGCSMNTFGTGKGFDLIYSATSIEGLILKAGFDMAKGILLEWLTAVIGNRQSILCINTAKANYRSSFYHELYL